MNHHPVLDALAGAGMRLGLDRVSELLAGLGNPHLAVPVVHVAGSNGKGSTCHMLAAALQAQGLRVGLTISPHMQAVNERIQIDGVPISDAELGALLDEVNSAALAVERVPPLREGEAPLTYFEATIVCAFLHFSRVKPDVAVVEVGLGGRLDASNVVRPEVCAITGIALEHTDRLGPDLASIAAEKAGIIKAQTPVVVGRVPKEALRVIRGMAADRAAPLRAFGEDFDAEGENASFNWRSGERVLEGLELGMLGAHQVENAAVAVAVLEELGRRRPALAVGEAALRAGLRTARNPGRLEWLAPGLLVDGAHNPDGAERLAAYLHALPRETPRTLLLGCSSDKDIRALAAALAPEFDRVFTTRCAHPRAADPGVVAEALVGLGVPVMPAGSIEEALPLARERGGLVVVAGSLFLAAATRDLVHEKS